MTDERNGMTDDDFYLQLRKCFLIKKRLTTVGNSRGLRKICLISGFSHVIFLNVNTAK